MNGFINKFKEKVTHTDNTYTKDHHLLQPQNVQKHSGLCHLFEGRRKTSTPVLYTHRFCGPEGG